MIEAAQIIPPLLRADLIRAGMRGDLEAIDGLHKQLRQMYPKLFLPNDKDDSSLWGNRREEPTNKRRAK